MILPTHATDCHMHVFGPFERYPLAAERAYNVEEAPLELYERMQRRVGLERTVLVQASGYGEDNRAMLEALARLGAEARGVAVVRSDLPQAELEALHAAGVRGVRFNLATLPSRYPGDRTQLISAYASVLAPLGWHLQVFADSATLLSLESALERCAVNVVIDHLGLPHAAAGLEQPGFLTVLRLL